MSAAFIVDDRRTPIGRFGGALATARPDDLAATAIAALVARHPSIDLEAVDENPRIRELYGVDAMPETGETVAADVGASREDQDGFALRSQGRAVASRPAVGSGARSRLWRSRSARACRLWWRQLRGGRRAFATMCIGVGQGIAIAIEAARQ